VASGKQYQLAYLNVGNKYYIDRSYTITNIPADLGGALWIKTANDDKNRGDSTFLAFTVSRNARIFVGYDRRASSLPNWLRSSNGWTYITSDLRVTDNSMGYFKVYYKDFSAGSRVELGGNRASGASGANSMYTVLVKERSTTPPPGTTSDLYGLCINANFPDQNPPDFELDALKVKWVRTLKYDWGVITPHGNVKWLVIFNSESIPRSAGESWSSYVTRFSDTVKQIVGDNSWISAIEVWNEEDLDYAYLSPQDYAQLLRETYVKVKSLQSPPIVVFGGLASGPESAANYVNQVKQQWGGSIFFDALGFHPYLATVDGIGWADRGTMEYNINTVYAVAAGRQVWLTEFGAAWQHFDSNNPINGKSLQAMYIELCYKLFANLKDGSKLKVGVAFWFAWDDRTHYAPNDECFGLVEKDRSGVPDEWRRPSWYAYYWLTHPEGQYRTTFIDGFESGTSRWKVQSADLSSSSSYRHSGSYSLQLNSKGPDWGAKDNKRVFGATYTSPFIAAKGSSVYDISVWVYSSDSVYIETMLYITQWRGTTFDTKVTKGSDVFFYDHYEARYTSSQSGWVQLKVQFTSYPETNYIAISLCINTKDKVCYFDDVVVKEG